MAVKIRAKQSLMGEYGKLRSGEEGYCKASTAKELVAKGMAEIVAENVEAPVKKIREHIFAKGYEPSKQEPKPVLAKEEIKDEPETAATKKEITEEEKEKKEQAELPKKQYK